MIYSKTIRM